MNQLSGTLKKLWQSSRPLTAIANSAQAIERGTRYVYDGEVRGFLVTVMETSRTRKDSIEKATVLWHAQTGYTWRTENAGTEQEFEVPDAFHPQRMVPKAELSALGAWGNSMPVSHLRERSRVRGWDRIFHLRNSNHPGPEGGGLLERQTDFSQLADDPESKREQAA